MQPRALRVPLALGALVSLAGLNLLLADGLSSGGSREMLLLGGLPAVLFAVGALTASSRGVLVYGALAIGVIGGWLSGPLPGAAAYGVYSADVLVCLALGAWIAGWLIAPPEERPRWPQTPVLGWPFVLFATALLYGVLQGHERYGTGFVSGPVRLIFYAGIAAAIADLSLDSAMKWITRIFYAGALWHAAWGVVHIAEGATQGGLSTGGVRIASLSSAGFLSGALALALINLDTDERAARRAIHLCFAALSAFGIMIAFGRTVFVAVALLIPLVLLAFRRTRSGVAVLLPLAAPILVLVGLAFPRVAPEVLPTFQERVSISVETDDNVRWREKAYGAIWQQVEESPITGVGFGRGASFTLDGVRWRINQDPHNWYLYLWAGGGILTLASFLLLQLVFLRDTWRRFRASTGSARSLTGWCLSMWFILAVTALTSPFMNLPRVELTYWVILLLPSLVRQPASEHVRERHPMPADRPARVAAAETGILQRFRTSLP